MEDEHTRSAIISEVDNIRSSMENVLKPLELPKIIIEGTVFSKGRIRKFIQEFFRLRQSTLNELQIVTVTLTIESFLSYIFEKSVNTSYQREAEIAVYLENGREFSETYLGACSIIEIQHALQHLINYIYNS